MNFIPVDSTTLEQIAYDPNQRLLCLQFHNNAAYSYFDVPRIVFEELLAAISKGLYFNRSIRGRFRYRRLPAHFYAD